MFYAYNKKGQEQSWPFGFIKYKSLNQELQEDSTSTPGS